MSDLGAADLDANFDRRLLKQHSARGAAATFIAQIIKFALKFGSTVVMARLLAPAEFGMVAMVSPIVAFAAAFNDIGFSQAIIRDSNLQPQQINSLFWLNLLVTVGLSAALIASAPVVALIYREPHVTGLLAAMTGWLLISTLSMVPTALMSREMRFVAATFADLAGVAVGIGCTIWAAWAGLSYWSLVIGPLIGSATSAAVAFTFSRWRPGLPSIARGMGEVARFGANLMGVNVATYVTMTADNIIVGAFAGKVALGLYDRSYALVVQPLGQLVAPLNRVALPLLSRLRDEPILYRRTYIQMLRLTLLLTVPAMLFCAVLAEPVILLLWGERWAKAIPVFHWFSIGGLVAPLFMTSGWLFVSEGRAGRQFGIAAAGAIISVASFLIGVTWGVVGVVRVSALTYIFLQTPLLIWGLTKGGILTIQDFARALLPMCIPAALTTAALYAIEGHVHGWWTVPTLALAYLVFGFTVLIMPGGRDLATTTWRLAASLKPGLKKPSVASLAP
jgi:PST family polysaccharide transporter